MLNIINDPIKIMFLAIEEVYPNLKMNIYLDPAADVSLGYIYMSEDDIPTVMFHPMTPYLQMVELIIQSVVIILTMEMNHEISDEEYDDIYDKIFTKYEDIGDKMYEDLGKANVEINLQPEMHKIKYSRN